MQTERQRKIAENLGLARKVARNWAKKKGLPYEDLLQIASEGLIKGIDRHDPTKGSFSTFVLKYCNGEVLHHLRDKHPAVKIPRALQERGQKLIATRTKLAAEWGRIPSRSELAKYLNLTIEQVDEATLASSNYFELQTTEDMQLISKEAIPVENSDRLASVAALINAMDLTALSKVLESGKLSETEAIECQEAIEQLCDFLVPVPVAVEVLDIVKPLAIAPVSGQTSEVLRVEGDRVITTGGTFPLYNVELNAEAIELMNDEELKIAINTEDSLIKGAFGTALYRACKAGRYLLAKKLRCQHGEWGKWLIQSCPKISNRTAQVYIRIARNWDAIAISAETAGLDLKEVSIEKALELIGNGSKPEKPLTLPPRLSNPNVFWSLASDVSPDVELDDWDPAQINHLLETIEAIRQRAMHHLRVNSTGSN